MGTQATTTRSQLNGKPRDRKTEVMRKTKLDSGEDYYTECTCKDDEKCKGRFFGCGYKPIVEWFKELPDWLQPLAMRRRLRDHYSGKQYDGPLRDSVYASLLCLEKCEHSIEGKEFWDKVLWYYRWKDSLVVTGAPWPSNWPIPELPPNPKTHKIHTYNRNWPKCAGYFTMSNQKFAFPYEAIKKAKAWWEKEFPTDEDKLRMTKDWFGNNRVKLNDVEIAKIYCVFRARPAPGETFE
jgi:hypothetical protein